jgi:hypothetical protein
VFVVLQALNSYVEQVARGITPRSTSVEFWVKDGEHLTRIDAQLPSTGSLGPLFFAFGLISQEELQAGTGVCRVRESRVCWQQQQRQLAAYVIQQPGQECPIGRPVHGSSILNGSSSSSSAWRS